MGNLDGHFLSMPQAMVYTTIASLAQQWSQSDAVKDLQAHSVCAWLSNLDPYDWQELQGNTENLLSHSRHASSHTLIETALLMHSIKAWTVELMDA